MFEMFIFCLFAIKLNKSVEDLFKKRKCVNKLIDKDFLKINIYILNIAEKINQLDNFGNMSKFCK